MNYLKPGPRRMPKQIIETYGRQLMLSVESGQLPPARLEELLHHLAALLIVSKRMGWTDIDKRITEWARQYRNVARLTVIDKIVNPYQRKEI